MAVINYGLDGEQKEAIEWAIRELSGGYGKVVAQLAQEERLMVGITPGASGFEGIQARVNYAKHCEQKYYKNLQQLRSLI